MNWFTRTIGTSIGKKLLMALTGLSFCGFLTTHLAGNLLLYKSGDAFNAYAEKLHSMGFLINLAELGLLTFALIHVITGALLYYENFTSRPVRYIVKRNAGGRTIGSLSMPYTGLFLLVFIIFHLLNFHFVDKTDRTIYEIVSDAFSKPGYVMFYILAMIVAAIHVSHGLWSAFQTLGADHPKYTPIIKGVAIVFSIIVGIGFGFIPIYVSSIS